VLIVLGILLAGFQFLLTEVAAYLLAERAFSSLADLMPDFVRAAAGPAALGFMSFKGIVSLGYFHPIVLTSLVGLTIAIATNRRARSRCGSSISPWRDRSRASS
jgi:hypothetical protein